jgi:DNA-binding protein HU-beta
LHRKIGSLSGPDPSHVCALFSRGYDVKSPHRQARSATGINKKQFIERMVEHTDSPRTDAEKHLEAFTTAVSEALKAGEEVQLPGFGKFYVREQKAREGRNPQSGEKMTIPASKVPAFRAGKSLKGSV